MTTLLQPPVAPPGPTPPAAPGSSRPVVVRLVATTLGALLLAALLNPDDVLARAQHQEFGRQRDVTVRIAEVNHSVSRALLLDRPRRALDHLLGKDHRSSAAPAPTGTSTVHPRRPTAADPLRIYLGGDSVAQAFGAALTRAARANGVVAPTVEFRLATGLSRPDYFDWPRRLAEALRRTPKPEVVIVMFGANDVQPIMTSTGPVRSGTDAWLAEYGRRVASTMELLVKGGVDVYWVGQPLMRSADLSRRVSQMDDVFAAEAARHPGVTFVDTRPLFAGSDGGYSAYLPAADGRPVLVRAPDGVHFTAAGGDRLTAAVLNVVSHRWPLPG